MKLLGGIDSGTPAQRLLFALLGIGFILGVWILFTAGSTPILPPGIFPSPFRVVGAFHDLVVDNDLFINTGRSLGLNFSGYLEAIIIVLPIGFLVGLFKYMRWSFQKPIDALRYVPLTALIQLFILWFGIGIPMKVHFLSFGILIYLLPVMFQRIDEVGDVYLKTVHTLGASDWQTFKTVYVPSVLSRLSDDIRVLTAISWTYIIVIEGINSNQGGLGSLIYYSAQRQGRPDKTIALLILIMIIGVLQDKIFVWLDRQLFPHKYQAREAVKSSKLAQESFFGAVGDYALMAFGWIVVGIYFVLMINEIFQFIPGYTPLTYIFGGTVWVFHLLFLAFLGLQVWKWNKRRTDALALQAVTSKVKSTK